MSADEPYGPGNRYYALAELLLSAPDPVTAIAHELGDQHGRLDAVVARLKSLEFQVSQLRSMQGPIG